MRDVSNGWILRYCHANVASFFFICVYMHVGRGLYYGSYKSPLVLAWSIGVIMLVISCQVKALTNHYMLETIKIYLILLTLKSLGAQDKESSNNLNINVISKYYSTTIRDVKKYSLFLFY